MQIRVSSLSIAYDGHTLFEDVSFEVPPHRTYCISGPSGCGKSSLFKAILGFVRPKTGEINIDGQPLDEKSVWHVRQKIAYVSQEPVLGSRNVLEAVHLPFTYKSNAHLKWDRQALDALFDRFALSRKLYDKETVGLSGGEKQRIAVITALLLDRPILLLDEPASALDKNSKHILKELLAELPKTVVFISHEPELLDIADAEYDLVLHGERRHE